MNIGKYVFSQVIEYIPRYQFDKLVKQYKGDWHSKGLNSYNHLLHLLFGQITGCDSLRDICLCLDTHKNILYHLVIRNLVTHTSLSRANENRDYRIFEGLGKYLIKFVKPMYSNTAISEITVDNVLYALDSTTISTSIPANIHVTDGKWHDSNELDELDPEPLAFYIADKAYVDFDALFRFHKAGAYWVSRPKGNMRYEIVSQRDDFDSDSGVISDLTIRLVGHKSKKLYPETIRLVRYHDSETDNDIDFITNNFEISALEVACLYRHRWDIEVFFKWIKQNIVVKILWGYSENAVRIHLWVAIIAYLTFAYIKADHKSPYSITEVATLIRISALEKTFLGDLISKPKEDSFQNQNVNERSLFNNI